MNKIQKIWMGIFIAMFAIPEILWSPILNFYYEFWQSGKSGDVHPLRDNFFNNSDNWNYLKLVIFIQLVGSILFLIYSIINKKNIKLTSYLLLIIISLIVSLLTAFIFYFAMTFNPTLF
jgi:hypothetical protein